MTPTAPAPPPTATPRPPRMPRIPRRSSTWLGSSFAPFLKSTEATIPGCLAQETESYSVLATPAQE